MDLGEWQCVDLTDEVRRIAWIVEASRVWAQSLFSPIEQHPSVVNKADFCVLELRGLDGLKAYILFKAARALQFRLLPRRQLAVPTRHLQNVGGVIGPGQFATAIQALPAKLARLPILLDFLPVSVFDSDIAASPTLRQQFHLMRCGYTRQHYVINLPDSYDGFLQNLSAKARQDARRQRRVLERQGPVRLVEYNDLDRFMAIAMPIAKMTYQFRELKIGLFDDAKRRAEYRAMAMQGIWRGHILYCGDEPVAFFTCCRYDPVHFGMDTGYRPDWSRLSVGRIGFLMLVEILIQEGQTKLDLHYGDQEWKRSFANADWAASHYMLVSKRSPRLGACALVTAQHHLIEVLNARLTRQPPKEKPRTT